MNYFFDSFFVYALPSVIIIDNFGQDCKQIGQWNAQTKTCLMTKNFHGFIEITDPHIVLDGNGFLISSKYSSESLKENGDPRRRIIDVKANDVTIKNVAVKGFSDIEMYSVGVGTNFPNLVVKDSSFYDHGVGIAVVPLPEKWDDRECLIENNTVFSNSQPGISTFGCTIKSNDIFENSAGYTAQSYGNNILENNHIHNNESGLKLSSDTVIKNTFEEQPQSLYGYRCGLGEHSIINNNFLENSLPNCFGGKVSENYYEFFDSAEEGCMSSPDSNFCSSSFTLKNSIDRKPWKIQDGWAYEFVLPLDIRTTVKNSDEKSVSFSVSARGPDGLVTVSCNPSSGDFFPIGNTRVICSTPNGIVSSFFVTVLDATVIEQNQQIENIKSGSIGFLKLLSLILGIVAIILIFKIRKKKKQLRTSSSHNDEQSYQQHSHQQQSYTYDDYSESFSNDNYDESKSYDSQNLSKEEAFEILEVNESFTSQEIKTSRNRLINQWHPDKHKTPLYQNIAEKQTKLIIASYELLRELGYAD